MNKFKQVFYHIKGYFDCTHIWRVDDSVKQIKSDIIGNGCVLDAIYYEDSNKVTLYSKNFTKSDIFANTLRRIDK